MNNKENDIKYLELIEKLNSTEKKLSFYKAALNALPNPIFIKDDYAKFKFFNKSYEEFFGIDSNTLIGTTVEESTYLDAKDKFRYHVEDLILLENQEMINYEIPFANPQGEMIPSLYWSSGFKSEKEGQRGLIGEIVGVSRLKTMENRLIEGVEGSSKYSGELDEARHFNEEMKQFFRTILNYYDGTRALLFDFRVGDNNIKNIATINKKESKHQSSLIEIKTEFSEVNQLIAKFPQNEARFIEKKNFSKYDKYTNKYLEKLDSIIYAILFSKEKEPIGIIVVENPKNNIEKLAIMQSTLPFIIEGMSKNKIYENLLNINYIDKLTGVFNRNKYTEFLKKSKRTDTQRMGILSADVNGLSVINELYGEHSGDGILIKLAYTLKKIFGETVYRIGEDEFLVIYPDTNQIEFEAHVESLKKEMSLLKLDNMSFGYTFDEKGFDLQNRISYANELMKVEKQKYYSKMWSEENKSNNYSHNLTQILLSEINEGKFVVFFQPQVNLRTEEVVGAEALVRKLDDNGMPIAPIEFLPFYEREKLIRHIDMFVLKSACEYIKKWNDLGKKIKISINLSRITLMERNIMREILSICQTHQIPQELIELEITETSDRIDDLHLKNILDEGIKAGFSLSLDDFGSEYSNLQMLTSMEFSQIKFDKSLIDNICTDKKAAIIVQHAINMCESLGISDLLAEGIETNQQKEKLKELKCISGQGYLFSKPIPPEEFEDKYINN